MAHNHTSKPLDSGALNNKKCNVDTGVFRALGLKDPDFQAFKFSSISKDTIANWLLAQSAQFCKVIRLVGKKSDTNI